METLMNFRVPEDLKRKFQNLCTERKSTMTGFLPYAAERVARVCSPDGSNEAGLARLRRFWFDTALSSSPYALPALLAFADPGRITFGSDWPFAPKERSLHFASLLDAYPLSDAQRHAIHRGNAERLFPRLSSNTAPTEPHA